MFINLNKVYCIGIGGIGVSAVAKLLHAKGVKVSGSDLAPSFITRELENMGIPVSYEQDGNAVPSDADLVIYTPAAGEDHAERMVADGRGIRSASYPAFLGELSRVYRTIAISGTHGKSTTTAMIGLILEAAGYDPTVIVGSRVPSFKLGNVRVGESDWLVVEACEHQGNMRHLAPHISVITAIEEDHLDFYKDINDIVRTFQEFVRNTHDDGVVVWNGNDANCARLDFAHKRPMSFVVNSAGDWAATKRHVVLGEQFFNVSLENKKIDGEWSLKIPGEFNVRNALAAAAAATAAGIEPEVAKNALADFGGIWRRFERVGTMPGVGAHVISDYGHHPTAIRVTLQAAREQFPGHNILLVFQPHQHNRTKKLFDGFVQEIAKADGVILAEIYDVAGREESGDQDVSSLDIIEAIGKSPEKYMFAAGLNEAEELVRQHATEDSVVVVMGAGDIWEIADRLVQ